MRARMVCGAFLVLASNLAAQAPAEAPATAPAAAPKPPKGPSRAEFRIGGFMVSGERNYNFASSAITTATGSVRGVEVLLRGSGAGIYVRSLSGTFGNQPKVISADARVLLFPPVFTIFAGVGKRALSSALATKVYDVAMAGVSSTVNIGGTGLRTHVSGAVLVSPQKGTTGAAAVKDPSKGIDAEAAIFYRFPSVPLFLTLGYRTEVFNARTGSVVAPEEVRGLRVGGGIQFGGR